jgi:hypothetical protein
MEFEAVKDSGERRDFDTGSRRDVRRGKGRFDLVNPIALKRLARHYENGGAKYGDHNWELGQPMMSYLDSAIRHLYTFIEGNRDEDHLAAVMWNAAAAIYTEEMIRRGILPDELDDMPDYLNKDGFEESVGRMTREFNERKKAEEVAKSAINIQKEELYP